MHIIAQDIGTFADYELVLRPCGMLKRVVGLEQGAARHAGVELAIGIARWRWEDTVGTRPGGLIVSVR